DRRAEADIGHEMPVHHVDMDVIGAGFGNGHHLGAQPGEIGRQDRGGDADGAGGHGGTSLRGVCGCYRAARFRGQAIAATPHHCRPAECLLWALSAPSPPPGREEKDPIIRGNSRPPYPTASFTASSAISSAASRVVAAAMKRPLWQKLAPV